MKNPPLAIIPLAIATGALAASLLFGNGCASGGASQVFNPENCSKAKLAYELYQATLEVRDPSKEEIMAAKIAAAFLAAQCGWTQETSPAARGTRGFELATDTNGVPIVHAP